MTLFHHEKPPNPSKICRFLSSAMKEVFFNCYTCQRSLWFMYHEEEEETPSKYFNDELEVVSITKARVMEAKLRRKSIQWNESFSSYFSVDTSFSNTLSFNGNENFSELKRRSIFHEFSYCEGWPFGLCKRAMLLPPLPKSPSDSWSWCKGSKIHHDKLMA
ncbi:hypothetical protein V2J09_007173 [Rumex salicifolius]